MNPLPEEVRQAWDQRAGAIVLTTVSPDGKPNSIYATCVGMSEDGRIVIADNYFHKTRENILSGSPGAVLFITGDNKAYQLKGDLEYHRDGKFFTFMKSWNPPEHPGHAAAVLTPREVYSGAKRLD
ncbi:MAG: pyridoxamine 5'-phosphate oxidase family protein [Victivallales bacterium]|nr:pyridoxamine 5'-phosphate oxidase family protein [Victivallales bacterium]